MSHDTPQETPVRRLFTFIVNWPKTFVILSLILIGVGGSFLPRLVKDTRADAFLAADNPALVYRDRVKEQFGLSDPYVIAVVRESDTGIFNPESLALVQWLTDEVSLLDNVDSNRVVSLATEKNIVGTEFGLDVTDFFDPMPVTQAAAESIRQAIDDFPLYLGSLVAADGQATLVVVEMRDEELSEATYNEIMDIVARAPVNNDEAIHVAGEGAVLGFLGSYIDADASRLNPIAGLIITLLIFFAFRRISPALLGNVIIAGSVLITLGSMAGSGVAFFVITNALPVILIGISVADAIHIYSHYFELQSANPEQDTRSLIVDTLSEMWRPVTLTTLTTMAGFLGLYFAAYMPPFKYFGLFTALGVFIAGFFSLVFLPAAMALTKPRAARHFYKGTDRSHGEFFARLMGGLGRVTQSSPRIVIGVFAVLALVGLYAATNLRVDDDRIAIFDPGESIYQADAVINAHFNGTNNLDIVIETPEPEALFIPGNLRKIEALQAYAETLPHVRGSTSIVDYLKQMNRALNDGAPEAYRLPDDRDTVAQYFLLYSASSDPSDFEEEVDYDYQTAMVRLNLNSGSYQNIRGVVESLQGYIDSEFNDATIQANLSGRVNVAYHWIKDLGESHFVGLGISLFLVWAVSALLFRSLLAGVLTLLPVSASILLVYAAMVSLGISLGTGTSMFASVAIGLGVDFAIHALERLRSLYRAANNDIDTAMREFYPTTGRALFFNFLTISCGFGVLISSKVVPLNNFGTIVVLAVSSSFIASMMLVPALIKVIQPRFFTEAENTDRTHPQLLRTGFTVLLVGLGVYLLLPGSARAAESLDVDAIVANVNAVDEGEFVSRKLVMTLTDRRGRERVRETRTFRKYFGAEKRSVVFYESPTNIRDTAFLTWDYPDPAVDDDQWLYLPSIRRVRRISSSDRGDYFLGTDLTYEDIKLEGKLQPAEFDYRLLGEEMLGDVPVIKLESTPKSDEIADELGYGRTQAWIDSRNWIVVKADFWDPKGQPLKLLEVSDIRRVDGIWTRHRLDVLNHQTGHRTHFEFSEVDYTTDVDESLLTQRALSRGR